MRFRCLTTLAGGGLIVLLAGPSQPVASAQSDGGEDRARALRRTPVVEVFEQSRDAVVNISSTEIIQIRRTGGFDRILEELFDLPSTPRTREYKRQSVGSGFVIHPEGYIATNAHVISRTTERRVTFADGREYEAEIIATDPSRDLAILKIDADGPLPTLDFGRSDDLMIGETVVAIGNPLGYQHTVTAGVVSAIQRDVAIHPELALDDLIQTDASINPGNSGGPLLNVMGELIGVNTAIRGDAQNIGFAIPVDRLREVLPELLDVHRRYRIESGLRLSGYDPRIVEVVPGSPADRAGLRAGDRLVEIDRHAVRESLDFDIGLIGKRAGDPVRLKLERDGRVLDRRLTLAGRPALDGGRLVREKLGLEVHPLPEDVARELRLPGGGLLVVEIETGGPADRIGLERRDVLLSLGRFYVAGLDDLGQLLESTAPGEELSISVLRVDRWGKGRMSGTITAR